jgi:hypothetical protein
MERKSDATMRDAQPTQLSPLNDTGGQIAEVEFDVAESEFGSRGAYPRVCLPVPENQIVLCHVLSGL